MVQFAALVLFALVFRKNTAQTNAGARVECGTNTFCYYEDLNPQIGFETSETVNVWTILANQWTYHQVYFSNKGLDCYNPTIDVIYENIDFNAASEYLNVRDQDNNYITYQCRSGYVNDCGEYATCTDGQSLPVSSIQMNDTYKITIEGSASFSSLCSERRMNAFLTITCDPAPTYAPTNAPTTSPTNSPTTSPTTPPSLSPSSSPTYFIPPTPRPTYYDCEDSQDIRHLNWNDIMDYGGNKLPNITYDITASPQDKTLSIDIELDYLGYSYADNAQQIGTTYHLGFYSFDGSSIISNCDNRMSSSYKNKTWTEYWEYSATPFLNNTVGSANFLAYPPPSEHWKIKMRNRCSKLKYSATFTWDDLSKCLSDDNETMAVDVGIDDKFINMSGIFFVDVLSPLSMVTDVGHYYTYELLSYPFVISIKKSIELLSATNTYWFTISVIKVGKNNDENIFKMIILTESAVDIPLANPSLLTAPNNNENSFTFIDNETECLLLSSHICSQIWEMTAIVDCPYTFSGDYGFQFNAVCDGSDESSKCENYTNVYGDTVSLSTGIVFQDDICDEIIWQIEYEAEAIFYNNNTFLTPISYDYQFTVGEDRVYVEIVVDDVYIDNTGYSVINTKLLNVWLCTITNKGQLTLDQNNLTNSGCFSSDIDSDGPYHIIVNYNESFTNGAQHESDSFSNIVRFSFIVPDTITSDVLYIQTQLGLEFVGENNGRRLLLEEQQANQIFHHFKGANVVKSEEFDVDTNAQAGGKGKGNNQTISMIMAIIGALFCGLLISCVCFVVYKRKHSGESKHNYGNVVSEQAVVDEIQNNDNCQQSIIEHEETLENV